MTCFACGHEHYSDVMPDRRTADHATICRAEHCACGCHEDYPEDT
jgi:hypothetical protein